MPAKKTTKTQLPGFEQSLEELETMVETMESGQLALEELISTYERGAKLISHCESLLDGARKRLDLITLEPKSPAKQPSQEAPETTSNDDDIRLF